MNIRSSENNFMIVGKAGKCTAQKGYCLGTMYFTYFYVVDRSAIVFFFN